MMAATLADGETVLENAAREPEVVDLAEFLNAMGARISGAGTDTISDRGRRAAAWRRAQRAARPHRDRHLPGGGGHDRRRSPGARYRADLLKPVIAKLQEAGADIEIGDNWIEVDMQAQRPHAVDVQTTPYPGFPTDMQAQFCALNAMADGVGTITETIFENRFMHVLETAAHGRGHPDRRQHRHLPRVDHLTAAPVMATDLRASASLVLAGLVADGETLVDRIYHIDRGYERSRKNSPRWAVRFGGCRCSLPCIRRSRALETHADRRHGQRTAELRHGRRRLIDHRPFQRPDLQATLPLLVRRHSRADDPETSRKLILDTNARAREAGHRPRHRRAHLCSVRRRRSRCGRQGCVVEHGGEGLYRAAGSADCRCRLMVAGCAIGDADADAPEGHGDCASRPSTSNAPSATSPPGAAGRGDQALRLHGAGTAGRVGRSDRRPGGHRQYPEGQWLVPLEQIATSARV